MPLKIKPHHMRGTVTVSTRHDGVQVKRVESARIGVHHEIHRLTPKGRKILEVHYRYEELHREHGPARITFDPKERPVRWEYFRRDSPHRIDGPAFIAEQDGERVERFYLYGSRYDDLAEVIEALERYNGNTLYEEFTGSSYARFLTEGRTVSEIADVLFAGVHTVAGIAEVFDGAPVEWARAFETGSRT